MTEIIAQIKDKTNPQYIKDEDDYLSDQLLEIELDRVEREELYLERQAVRVWE